MTATSLLQLERAQAFISALSNFDCDTITPILSPEFTHRIFPLSLGERESCTEQRRVSGSAEKRGQHDNESKYIIQAQDVVIFHLLADGKTKNGKKYKNEYMFTIRFDGEQIHGVREFMDSQYVTAALAELA
ncbi:hypothetical protein B0H13DRAFT_1878729 [Mycena leptocephala]|nr:hypothetical protein B0H13DRAFT_1878729 [Mycena leptocephala]